MMITFDTGIVFDKSIASVEVAMHCAPTVVYASTLR